jgi:thiosulfate/3-mercaptopyruvate sulfurtransferase
MNSSRLWWALKIYGHENIKVVSGGITALKVAGAEVTTEVPSITATSYSAKDLNTNMLATIDEVKAQVNTPDKNTILLDVRSEKEYDEGTIPSSILLNYENNIYNDKTFKSPQDIKIMYLENKIKPSNNIIMFCKTSVRAAQTYLALYEAGYKNLKLYDGAWLEWDADKSLPIQIKNMENNNTTLPTSQDNS